MDSYAAYRIGGTRRIIINGDLSWDPDEEVLIVDSNTQAQPCITVSDGGSLTIGNEVSGNGNVRLSSGVGLVITIDDESVGGIDAHWRMNVYGAIYVAPGGTFVTRGGVILSSRGFGFYTSASTETKIDVVGTKFTKIHTAARREFRFNTDDDTFTDDTQIDGAIMDGFQISHRHLPSEFSPVLLNSQIVQLADSPGIFEFSNLDTSENLSDTFDIGTDNLRSLLTDVDDILYTIVTVNNASAGSGLRLMPKQAVGTDRQRGILVVQKELTFSIADASGSAVEGAKVYIRDTDNGYRKMEYDRDHRADKVYTGTSDDSGNVATLRVVTAVSIIDSLGAYVDSDWDTTNHSNRYKVDRRGKTDTPGEDLFDATLWGYGFLPSTVEMALTGLDPLNVSVAMVLDGRISERDKTVVDAYTEIATPQQAYDAMLSWKLDNLDSPSQTTLPATRNGNVLDCGAYDVTLDSTAADLFDFDSANGITIKTSTFTGDVTTSGTISTNGSVTVVGGLTDSTGSTATVSISAHTNERVAIFREGVMIGTASDLTSDDTVHFSLSSSQTHAEIKAVCVRSGYEPQVRNVNTTAGGTFLVEFDELIQIVHPDGLAAYTSSTSDDISISFSTELSDGEFVPSGRIAIGNIVASAQQCFDEVETAMITSGGLKFVAYGGKGIGLSLSPTAGNAIFLGNQWKLKRAASGDINSGVRANVFESSTPSAPIDNENGGVALTGGVDIRDFQKSLITDFDIDPDTIGTQSVAGFLININQTSENVQSEIISHGFGAELTVIHVRGATTDDQNALLAIKSGDTITLDGDEAEVFSRTDGGNIKTVYVYGDDHSIGSTLSIAKGSTTVSLTSSNKQTSLSDVTDAGDWFVEILTLPSVLADIQDRVEIDQDTFDTRMAAVPDATKDTYKADLTDLESDVELARDHARAANQQTQST